MTWLERALYLFILAVLGVSIFAMKQRNETLDAQAAAAAEAPPVVAEPADDADDDEDEDDDDDDEEEG